MKIIGVRITKDVAFMFSCLKVATNKQDVYRNSNIHCKLVKIRGVIQVNDLLPGYSVPCRDESAGNAQDRYFPRGLDSYFSLSS